MEFFLVDEKPFSFSDHCWAESGYCGAVVAYKENFALEPLARYYCKSLLNSASVSGNQDEVNPTLKLQLVVPVGKPKSLRICSGDEIKFLDRIRGWYGEDNVRIGLKLAQFNGGVMGETVDCFEATDLPIKDLSEYGNPCGYGSEMSDFKLKLLSNFCGWLTVSIKLTEHAAGQLFLQVFGQSNQPCGNKRLLEDAVCTDLVILAANGAENKCHRAMLAVRSDVFKTMFENKMKESITGVVEMPDMSAQAVKGFLGFIYYWNMKEASESCDIALEILVAADKYNILDLVLAIVELIAVMPNDWFNVDMSVKLLMFTERQRRICKNKEWVQLQEKVIRVLKFYTKDSFDILSNSQVYQQLFRDNPETAMQISTRFLSFNE